MCALLVSNTQCSFRDLISLSNKLPNQLHTKLGNRKKISKCSNLQMKKVCWIIIQVCLLLDLYVTIDLI